MTPPARQPVSDVVIAGAGIGGLTLAIALRHRGVRVTVLERAPEIRAAGAGLTLGPNAMRALERLGLAEAATAAGVVVESAAILDRRGRRLGPTVPLARIRQECGAPLVALHRARLHDVLLDAVGPDVVRTGVTVEGYETRAGGVDVVSGANRRFATELLIGADGLSSAVRAQLVGDGPPVYSGYTSWRGVTPAGSLAVPPHTSETWGRGKRFGIVNIGFGEIYWFAVANTDAGGRDGEVRRELLARFDGWHAPIAAVIAATPAERIIRTDICDRPPIDRWHEGRVALLGDAAHPMTPNLGQGAAQAIEDAIVLDRSLQETDSLDTALRLYERRRTARANAIVRASRRFGVVAQLQHPVATAVRDLAMRLTPPSVALAQALSVMRVDL